MTTAAPARAVRKAAEHVCVDCLAMPAQPVDPALARFANDDEAVEYRPRTPRPAPHGGPKSKRCTTHQRAHKAAARVANRTRRGTKVYGLDAHEQQLLLAFQQGRCPCGRPLVGGGPWRDDEGPDGTERMRITEHDHRCCPPGGSRGDCVRGYTCPHTNREVIGKGEHTHATPEQHALALLRTASFLIDPPLARLRRGEATPYLSPLELAEALAAATLPTPKDVAA